MPGKHLTDHSTEPAAYQPSGAFRILQLTRYASREQSGVLKQQNVEERAPKAVLSAAVVTSGHLWRLD